ncbi:MAG: DUF58 domain-containing protein [Clostridia bacterium]|nr:DUF58 domain-containing protein [Clostridia bacterium]
MIPRRVGYLCWLLAVSVLYFFENNTGTRAVLASSILIPAFSVCCAAWTAKKASCRLNVPEKVGKGSKAVCRCAFSVPWTLIGCALCCRVRALHLLTHESSTWDIGGGGENAFTVNCAHCGTMAISTEDAFACDWLGLARFSIGAQDSASLLILPELYPVRISRSARFSMLRQDNLPGQPWRNAEEMENSGVRDYAPGDPVRRIHWKLSGKLDRILIREGDRPLTGAVLLLLETAGYDIAPEDMDASVEALLSVSRALTEEGIMHCVSWQDRGSLRWIEISGETDGLAMRDTLLNTEAYENGESIGTAFSRAFPDFRADHTVIFSPRPDTDAMSMRETGEVTLALPHPADGNPDVQVVRISHDVPTLEL